MSTNYPKMKRFPVTHSFINMHTSKVGRSNRSHLLSSSTGPVSPFEQPDRPGFRANFSHWGPVGLYLKPNPIRAVLKLPKARPIHVSSGFDYLRTDQMFARLPLLRTSGRGYETAGDATNFSGNADTFSGMPGRVGMTSLQRRVTLLPTVPISTSIFPTLQLYGHVTAWRFNMI
jgi:hypothetical protein